MKPCKLMFAEFEKKFLSFDYDFYDKVINGRDKNKEGNYKASDLIIEIARLSGAFVSDRVRSLLDEVEVSFCAFMGWSISYSGILGSKNYRKTDKVLKSSAKHALNSFRGSGANIGIEDVGWIIFCCAMLREKFYSQFKYKMIAFQVNPNDGEETIEVAYAHTAT